MSRPALSVGRLIMSGYTVVFSPGECYIKKGESKVKVKRDVHVSALHEDDGSMRRNDKSWVVAPVAQYDDPAFERLLQPFEEDAEGDWDEVEEEEEVGGGRAMEFEPVGIDEGVMLEELVPEELRQPRLPGVEEQIRHRVAHLPYAPWCEICIKAKGRNRPHFRLPQREGLPIVQMDYYFLNADGEKVGEDDSVITVLALIDLDSGFLGAIVVQKKGPGDLFAAKFCVSFLNILGYERIVL